MSDGAPDEGVGAPVERDSATLTRRARWLLPSGSVAGVWIEAVAFSAIAIAMGRYFSPEDPLLTDSHFPWPWFAPVLLALRYGVMPGIASSALLLAGWYLLQVDPVTAEVPKLYFLGGLLMV